MSPSNPRVAVILSGCGVHDGSEIHESVAALLALDRAGARLVCAAPNVPQPHVINHLTGEINPHDSRNVLVESARIARGSVVDLATVRVTDIDAAVFPGGYGAAKTLSDYASRGRDAQVHPEVARLVREMHAARKPMAFFCIAPVLAARVLGEFHPRITIGTDAAVAADLEAWGARHQSCQVQDIVVDHEHKIVSTPAYMLATRISEVAAGIERAVRAMLEMI